MPSSDCFLFLHQNHTFMMHRFLLTIAFSLLFFSVFGNIEENVNRKVVFPVIETPAVFTGTVEDEDFLIFVERSEEDCITGHYMSLEQEMADTLPFRLEALGRRARLYYNGERETFRPNIQALDDKHAEGIARLNLFQTASFEIDIHHIPDFQDFENNRYQDTLFAVEETSDIPYAKVMGYWSKLRDETAVTDKIFKMRKAFSEVPLELQLDVFKPLGDTLQKRPLVMLIHGGAFYFGSKDDKSITLWCQHLASKGYVTATIDYRIGFLPTMNSIGRAGYRAVQDAHAAMRFLVAHQEEYGIDTSIIFVGGASAGAITTLNLAFMTNETRPEYTHRSFLRPDLGNIDTCGNAIRTDFRIRGLIDMWGAMPDTTMLRGRNIPIIAFHGDADDIVPYGYDYPFAIADMLKTLLVEKMYGSSCIVDRSIKLGHKAYLVTFSGYKHSPHVDPVTKELNYNFYIIQDMMSDFLYDLVVPEKPEIKGEKAYYSVEPKPLATSWQVEGGIILDSDENTVKVAWIGNAPKHSITASAAMPYGTGFNTTKTID